MKKLSICFLFILATVIGAFAQETKPAEQPDGTAQPVQQQEDRNAFLKEIGLTPDQIRQIRRLNMDRKATMQAAQQRMREANRLLDEAIYSDQLNESDVQLRMKDAQAAQAEVFRLRSTNELAIRRILTSEQLVRFREMRQQFEASREQQRTQRKMENGMRPNKRFPTNGARPFAHPNQPQKQP
jgi:Spy/CpxP family protein refolding chaperone